MTYPAKSPRLRQVSPVRREVRARARSLYSSGSEEVSGRVRGSDSSESNSGPDQREEIKHNLKISTF